MVKYPDKLPSALSPQGTCTRCGLSSQFKVYEKVQLTGYGATIGKSFEQAYFLQCLGCNQIVITISTDSTNSRLGLTTGEPFFYFPPLGFRVIDDSIPNDIGSCYEESQRCLSVAAYRATVVMCRSALALFVKDKGSSKANEQTNLDKKLGVMIEEGDLHTLIGDWAHLVRTEGNAGAHPENYEPVSKEKAESISELTKQMLFLHYEVPAEVLRARESKTPKTK